MKYIWKGKYVEFDGFDVFCLLALVFLLDALFWLFYGLIVMVF